MAFSVHAPHGLPRQSAEPRQGQDGPDDFDRPQTVASCAAVVSTLGWGGADLAVTAVRQIFDAIDLVHDGQDEVPERRAEVEHEIEFVRRIVTTVVGSERHGRMGLTPEVLAAIRF